MGSRLGGTGFTAMRSSSCPLGFAVGVGAFFAICSGVPWLLSYQSGPFARGFNQGISAVLAPIAWLVFALSCLPALVSFSGSYRRRELLDTRNTLKSLSAKGWSRFERLVAEVPRPQGYVVEEIGLASAESSGDLVLCKNGSPMVVQSNAINSNFVPLLPKVAVICLSVLIIVNYPAKNTNRVALAFDELISCVALKFISCPELLLRSYRV
ncbi:MULTISPECIES: hypothetical protein [Xanthomonas]|uniref:hypothetical protein n=1 Tax=Xanthomonas TaxID=338 RepID=UPI000A6B52C2|nr:MULTISPECIES: hypothetical protein [Xanthomonas]